MTVTIPNWNQHQDAVSGALRFSRTYDDGTDVIIEITQSGNSVVVISKVESRTSGPVETKLGEFNDVSDAERLVRESCAKWDAESGSSKPDFRGWKLRE
jgi:hypothetical protein